MIDFKLPFNAQFYKTNENITITNDLIDTILQEACSNKLNSSYLINEKRVSSTLNNLNYKYTFRVYKSKKRVDFVEGSNIFDIIHSYILLIEYLDYLIIFKKSTATISSSVTDNFHLIKYNTLFNLIDDKMDIQRASFRNMTISNNAIHSHSYETPGNLNGLLSTHSAGKSIPKNMKFKHGTINKSITSSTGRVIESLRKEKIEKLFLWSAEQIDLIILNIHNKFLEKFAQPEELNIVLKKTEPKSLFIEANILEDSLMNDEIKFGIFKSYQTRDKFRPITNQLTIDAILKYLNTVYEFNTTRDITNKNILPCKIINPNNGIIIGELKINEKSLTFDIPFFKRIYIKDEGKTWNLQKYLIHYRLYTIIFFDFKYMYFQGTCFKDSAGVSEIDSILNILEEYPLISSVINEKGTIVSTDTNFDSTSMFHIVEQIRATDDYIFCDDLGNEWCDHITIDISNKRIRFIHSKANFESLSASKMHDVVGQGIKNIGNMFFTIKDFTDIKKNKFLQKYTSGNGILTNIDRCRKGALTVTDLNTIETIINNYETHRECILSCSFISKSVFDIELKKVKSAQYVKGNIIQLIWIISSFVHACKGAGVIPKIYCKP